MNCGHSISFGTGVVLAILAATCVSPGGAAEPASAASAAVTEEALLHDWMLQDHGADVKACFADKAGSAVERKMLARVLGELGGPGEAIRGEMDRLIRQKVPGEDAAWRELYVKACRARRAARLRPLLARSPKIVFTKHYDLGGSHYAYTEGQSDAQAERHFRPGTALCVLEADENLGTVRTLIDDPKGVIRDPDVSYDGKRILFAWKKSDRQDDYHLYEMDVATGKVRQLTDGLGFADYEGQYLPTGEIVFNSTRCVQIVDCWWTEVSNLYVCDADGRYMRRLAFDQVHSNYPTVTDDGRVIYTRWDYNDRGQLYPQPLYQMNCDGTGQTEVYGNNSWFPTTVMHARAIPGTQKILAVFSGHHCRQRGKLGIIDPTVGQQEATGAQLVAPIRETKAVRVDAYGQRGELWQYPYPVTQTQFLVTYRPSDKGGPHAAGRFAIYFQDIDGRRELLAFDPRSPCNQSVPLTSRKRPHVRPSNVDYSRKTGTYYVKDVYFGPGLKGIERGTIKRLRVVALEYRAAGIGSNRNGGPAGGALVSTPVSVDNGTWDVKTVLGSVPVREDGSALFTVPARTPVYFQLLDERGCVVQSMRSWSTLQPGETFSCVGCHESKADASPMTGQFAKALEKDPLTLTPFYGPARGFSFPKEIQPILDRHCIRCHFDRGKKRGAIKPREPRVRPGRIPATASHSHSGDAISALSDQAEPKNSNDHSIPRFTWWSHRGTREWVQYNFKAPKKVSGVQVYWFEDTSGCRTPKSWKLLYKDGSAWKPVSTLDELSTAKDRFVKVSFAPVRTTSLRIEVLLKKGKSSGILEWKVIGENVIDAPTPVAKTAEKPLPPGVKKAFSLLGEGNLDRRAKRMWSDSYLALTQNGRPNKLVQWLNAQSIPPMLPPYFAGSARSELITMLEKGHNSVKLTREEMEKLCCWIDLLVPYCGDYTEANAWSDREKEKYARYQAKRDRMAEIERKNIQALLGRSSD